MLSPGTVLSPPCTCGVCSELGTYMHLGERRDLCRILRIIKNEVSETRILRRKVLFLVFALRGAT